MNNRLQTPRRRNFVDTISVHQTEMRNSDLAQVDCDACTAYAQGNGVQLPFSTPWIRLNRNRLLLVCMWRCSNAQLTLGRRFKCKLETWSSALDSFSYSIDRLNGWHRVRAAASARHKVTSDVAQNRNRSLMHWTIPTVVLHTRRNDD